MNNYVYYDIFLPKKRCERSALYCLTLYWLAAAAIPEQPTGRSIDTKCPDSAGRAKCRSARSHIPHRVQPRNISL
ncbi:hypothetical protein QUB30_14205 [Microcoleus sp. BROC3]